MRYSKHGGHSSCNSAVSIVISIHFLQDSDSRYDMHLAIRELQSTVIATFFSLTAVITPLSYTARLGNVGIFRCAVTGSNIISWYINELPSGYPSIRRRGIYASRQTSINATWIQSSLTIPATWENNGVSIDCAALLDGPQTHGISELATFHVQGPLLPPANLTLEVLQDQTYLILRWSPHSGNESTITMYTVYVNVSHTGAVTHYNTSMRNYTIRNSCGDVSFKVTAWDNIGEGSTAAFLAYRHNSTGEELLHFTSCKLLHVTVLAR